MQTSKAQLKMKEAEDEMLTVTHRDSEGLVVELDLADSYDMHEKLI